MNKLHKITCRLGAEGTLLRQLGLALVLGLLAASVMIVTANAYVAVRTDTTLADFDRGTFVYTGLLDIPPTIDSVQLLPIGLTGQWRRSNHPLPQSLANLSAVLNGTTLLVVGGTDPIGNARAEVYSSQMSQNGELTSWQSQAALPEGRAGVGLVLHCLDADSSMLYVVGGFDPDYFATDTVYRAEVNNATGQVDGWTTDGQAVPEPLYYASAVEHENALYVIGGFGGPAHAVPFANVRYAPIAADGSLQAFVETSPLPEPLYSGHAVVYEGETNDTLYYIGGMSEMTSTFKVYFADFVPGGGLTAWHESDGKLPIHLYAHSGALINYGEILVTGGIADAVDPTTGISSTVKAALVDEDNSSFRLYDWCRGNPECTIGAWQTGALLPEVRALHASVASSRYVYVVGGIDVSQNPQNSVFFGTVSGFGALYSPKGLYRSEEINLGQPAALRRLDWGATIFSPRGMGLRMRYRTAAVDGEWSGWSDPVSSVSGTNQISFDPPHTNIRYFQYQANFTTNLTNSSPLLNWVNLYYEVPDPEVAVYKDTGDVVSVTLNNRLDYTIYYTNHGGWVAENVVLTETLPENTFYAGGPEWHRIDASNLYTYSVGDLERGETGIITFTTQVNGDVPKETRYINNAVEINYPPMTDAFGQRITDPELANNYFEFSNPFLPYVITITKDSLPLPGEFVGRGQVITYTLTYSNLARAAPARNAHIVDLVPEHTTYVPNSIFGLGADDSNPTQLRWNLGTIAAGQRGEVGFAARVDASCPIGIDLSNTSTLYSSAGPPKTSNTVTHPVVATVFRLLAGKDAIPPPGSIVEPGSTITYTLLYTNAGLIPASQAVLTDVYDYQDSYTFVSANPPPDGGTDNVWHLGRLAPGRKGSIRVVVTLDDILPSNWTVTNRTTVVSPEGEPAYSPVITHKVMNPPDKPLVDLVVDNIRLVPPNPKPGDPVDFFATISNTGTLDAGSYFWVGLYIKPHPSTPPLGPSDSDQGYCLNACTTLRPSYVWYASHLDKGQRQEVWFRPQNDPPIFPADGIYDLYVQVDLAFDDPNNPGYYHPAWGVYPEEDESNNITRVKVTVGRPKIYLPSIFKRWP